MTNRRAASRGNASATARDKRARASVPTSAADTTEAFHEVDQTASQPQTGVEKSLDTGTHTGRNSGADAPVRGRPPGRPAACGNVLLLRAKGGSRGTRADQGVRPTNASGIA